MTHQLDTDDFFIHRVQEFAARAGLNFFLIEPIWVEQFFQLFTAGKISCRVLLNMHSEHHQPEDIYHRLVLLAAERGSKVIDPPEIARASFDKAALHPKLIGAGLHVPYTIIVPIEQVDRIELTPEQKEAVGDPFVIKPSMGYGKRGLILEAHSTAEVARSVAMWRNPHYLLQRRIRPRLLNERPAYFRVFHVFGELWFCWWNCFNDRYAVLGEEEMNQLQLHELRQIVLKIASITGMQFFSSEIALQEDNQFVVIDYVNDQCHLLTQSANPHFGVPDLVVEGIARRLVEVSAQLAGVKQGRVP
jgi:hypothetical protein